MKSVAYYPLPVALEEKKKKSRLKLYLAFWGEFWQVKPEGSLQLLNDHNVHQNIHANHHAENDSHLAETKERLIKRNKF